MNEHSKIRKEKFQKRKQFEELRYELQRRKICKKYKERRNYFLRVKEFNSAMHLNFARHRILYFFYLSKKEDDASAYRF